MMLAHFRLTLQEAPPAGDQELVTLELAGMA